jgi:hypothetical protein
VFDHALDEIAVDAVPRPQAPALVGTDVEGHELAPA